MDDTTRLAAATARVIAAVRDMAPLLSTHTGALLRKEEEEEDAALATARGMPPLPPSSSPPRRPSRSHVRPPPRSDSEAALLCGNLLASPLASPRAPSRAVRRDARALVLVAADHAADALDTYRDPTRYEVVEVKTGDGGGGGSGSGGGRGSGDVLLLWELFSRLARGDLRGRVVLVASRSRAAAAAVAAVPSLAAAADLPAHIDLA